MYRLFNIVTKRCDRCSGHSHKSKANWREKWLPRACDNEQPGPPSLPSHTAVEDRLTSEVPNEKKIAE